MASHLKNLGRRAAMPALLAAVLSGCAGQMAYRDGRALIAEDKIEAGLLKYQQATLADPNNAQFRAAYLRERERATQRLLDQADRLRAEGKPELAEQNLLRVQGLDPQNERARASLRLLERDQRLAKLLDAARAHIERNELEQAKQKLNAILTEQPAHDKARLLLRDVSERQAPAATEAGLAKAYKQAITIEFRDAPLKQVFDVISRRSGLNFIFDKDVKLDQRTTILLKNSTVESAIYFMLLTNQLEQQVMDANTILIFPNVAAKLKEYQEMSVKTFFMANAEAKQVANTLKTILKTRDVVVDEKLNLLIVRDTPEAIRLAERLVALQDTPEPEVMLEVEILEVNRGSTMDLGVAWPTSVGLTPLSTSNGAGLTIRDLNNLNQRSIAVSGVSGSLNANTKDNNTNLLANPRIRVRNKEKASIVIGDKLPVITTTVSSGVGGFASDSISLVEVGLKLNVEPIVYLNNEVAIRVALEVSNLTGTITTKNGGTAYQIGTRQATTMLQLKDGENQVLAGLINSEERGSGNHVPGFGDLPVLGRLFGNKRDDNQKTEIVLSITPHLIRNLQRPEASVSEFSAGTEASFRRRPDFSARVPAGLPAAAPLPVPAPLSAPLPAPVPAPVAVSVPAVQSAAEVSASAQSEAVGLPVPSASVAPTAAPASQDEIVAPSPLQPRP